MRPGPGQSDESLSAGHHRFLDDNRRIEVPTRRQRDSSHLCDGEHRMCVSTIEVRADDKRTREAGSCAG